MGQVRNSAVSRVRRDHVEQIQSAKTGLFWHHDLTNSLESHVPTRTF